MPTKVKFAIIVRLKLENEILDVAWKDSPYLLAYLECINPKIFFLRPHGGDTSKGQPKYPIALDNCWFQGEQGGEEGSGGIHGRLFQELR